MCEFCGFYYVFGGVISFIVGIGLDDFCIVQLMICFVDGMVQEVIFVINLNLEGEVMVSYLSCLLMMMQIIVLCFVFGLLVGGDFEYVDEVIFGWVFEGWCVL